MVGLFKKLSKKKKKDRKGFGSASEDESCTEDEVGDKLSYHRNFAKEASQESSNGIRSVTPSDCSRNSDGESLNHSVSSARNSFASSTGTFEEGRRESFDVENIDRIVNSLDNDETLSITSADEGSLFDEDILSQFQDGQISLQQFLQSPHLSRSEERIRDEEMDSMFSDSRSVESSNYYSDSSSDSTRTEQRDEELDRIAGELLGDYTKKFANNDDRFSIQKTSNNNKSGRDYVQSSHRDSYYSIGEETITNSINDLTLSSDKPNQERFTVDIPKVNSIGKPRLPTPNEIPEGTSNIADAANVFSTTSCVTPTSTTQPDSLPNNCRGSSALKNTEDSPRESSFAESSDPYTPRRVPLSVPENLPVSPVSFQSISPVNTLERPSVSDVLEARYAENNFESPKSLLDRVHGRLKTPVDQQPKRKDTPIDLCLGHAAPLAPSEEVGNSAHHESRPASAQSQISQREVAIIDNTVMSLEGNFVITSDSNTRTTPSKEKSQRIEDKVDPWLSYLPQWKATASTEASPARCVSSVSDQGIRSRKVDHLAAEEIKRPASAVPPKLAPSPSSLSEQDRYIRFSSLDIDFFIPPPPVEDDTISQMQEANAEATPFNLEWDYEIADSPTLTPSSSVIYLGNRGDKVVDEADPIAQSLLAILPIQSENFEQSVCSALGEVITEIVSTRQKFLKLTKVLELQDFQIKEQRKLLLAQAKELGQLKGLHAVGQSLNSPRSPHISRRNEFNSYPATGRRSKELIDLENTLDKLLYQCHTLQRNSKTGPELQVFQPVDRSGATSSADSYISDDVFLSIESERRAVTLIEFSVANYMAFDLHEAKLNTLNISLREVEGKKRILEEAVDTLNEEIAGLKANEQMNLAAFKDKEEEHAGLLLSAHEMKTNGLYYGFEANPDPGDPALLPDPDASKHFVELAWIATLEEQMESHRENHSKQVNKLRDEVQQQHDFIQQLKEVNESQRLAEDQLRGDNNKLQDEVTRLKDTIQELEITMTKKETAHKDLQGLEETVARELATLNKLRQLFVKDLQSRMKVSTDGDIEADEANAHAQKQKITFLENNLEQLTKVHKQLVRDNADLRLELPKLEKRLKATQERVRALENAVKEAREGAMKDKSRFAKEVERLKQNNTKNQSKPIRPGHNPNQPAINSNSLSVTSVDSQISSPSIIRATSPSKIPIVPAGSSDRATPVIRGGLRSDGEAIVGGSGVSQRIKNAVGSDTLPRTRSSRGSDDPRRASMYVESTHNMAFQEHNLRSSASMDRLNMITGSSSAEKGRRLPQAVRTGTPPNLSGREAEIQALMNRNRSSPAFHSHGESPWELRKSSSRQSPR
eukprot:gene14746-5852_t